MQTVGANLLAVLESRERDLVDLYEFYSPAQTTLTPANASYRYAPQRIIHNGQEYTRQVVSRGDVSRFMSDKFNTVRVTLSNTDRVVGGILALASLEGWRLLIRAISRSIDNDSVVIFVGRIEKPFEVDDTTIKLSAKQDLGSINTEIPWREQSRKCPLVFKGVDCLAGESLGSKSGTYQAAPECNKSWEQCSAYGNTKAFQGMRFQAVQGTFKVLERSLKAGAVKFLTIGKWKLKDTKQYSSQDSGAYGTAIPLVFGRAQLQAIPVQHADTGQYLAGIGIFCEGPIAQLSNVRPVSDGWASTFQAYDDHKGEFGYNAEQTPTGFFASGLNFYSKSAYVEYTIKGTNPDTGDPAPDIAGLILGQKVPVPSGSSYGSAAWSDNPAHILRYILLEARGLNYNASWIDDASFIAAGAYCDEPIADSSNGEQLYLSDEIGNAGTDFKRYRSTGVLDTNYFLELLGGAAAALVEATYNSFDAAAPPSSVSTITAYRRRYTANFALVEKIKAIDFLFKKLLPSFRGYIVTSSAGKLQLRIDKPQLHTYLRGNTSIGATAITVEDVDAWRALTVNRIFAIVGLNLASSETVKVLSADYSTAGNSITLATSVSGTITATRSGAALSGGSTSAAASGTVTVGGTITAGNTATITIDGVGVTYTINASDTTGTVAGNLAVLINANTTLNRYIRASWSTSAPTVVTITSKLGALNLSAGMANAHTAGDQIMHVHLPFAHNAQGALTAGNVLKQTFKWPLGSRQTSYNRFTITYNEAIDDFLQTELNENDYTHQGNTNQINKFEIDGTCVDNYSQADRLVRAARFKYRDGDDFAAWASSGLALLLEEGDVVCTTHANQPGVLNRPRRLEEVVITPDHRVRMIGRLYALSQYPSDTTQKTVSLITAVQWPLNGPSAPTSLTLTQPTPGTIRGTFAFGNYIAGQTAKIEIQKAGTGTYADTGLRVAPDASGNGAFEIGGVPSGSTSIRVTPLNSSDVPGTATTATITVSNPLSPRIEPGLIAAPTTIYNPTVS